METVSDIALPIILLVGATNSSISLGYLWLKLRQLDSHIEFLLALIGLQNLTLLVISIIAALVIPLNPSLDKDICAWVSRPIFIAFNGNLHGWNNSAVYCHVIQVFLDDILGLMGNLHD